MHSKASDTLCRHLGYEFRDPGLLARALTHRSFSADHNERLEFLGDSVLGCIIAKYLYSTYPQLTEGELSRLRSSLVREKTLALLAQRIDLGSRLKFGEGERKSGGSRRPSILADAMEAMFGAIMLDGGFAEAEKAVLALFVPYLAGADIQSLGKDAKTMLQEYLQGRRIPLPSYSIVEVQGESHAQLFRVECAIPSMSITTQGEGASRRSAEQQAAQAAYQRLVP